MIDENSFVELTESFLPDAPLMPHRFSQKVGWLSKKKTPRILVSPDAYKRMQLYVELADQEIGWVGTAFQLGCGDYYIEHVFLLKQSAGAAHTRISHVGLRELYNELRRAGRHEHSRQLKFWGHSHVRMHTEPSAQDDETMIQLQEQRNKWYIRGIFNKHGRATFDLFWFDRNIRCLDVPWEICSRLSEPIASFENAEAKRALAAAKNRLAKFKEMLAATAKSIVERLRTSKISSDQNAKPPKSNVSASIDGASNESKSAQAQLSLITSYPLFPAHPLHISAELREEVAEEIRAKVEIDCPSGFIDGLAKNELPGD
jgi:hypothetical protein